MDGGAGTISLVIDVRRLRTELDDVVASLARRGIDTSDVLRAASLDTQVRELNAKRDELRAQIKNLSKEVGAAHKAGDKEKAESIAAESRELGDQEKVLDAQAAEVDDELCNILLVLPNIPAADVPDGASEDDNPVREVVNFKGVESYADFQRVPHWEVGTQLGILDLERGAKISGSMFPLFRGAGAALLRALTQLAIDINRDMYEEIRPPSFVRTETLIASGHLPKFADDQYAIERDDLWAIATAEVPLTSMGRDETIDEVALPQRYVACTPCFRREAGSAGKDTRGLLRVHEFDKVELLAVCTPEQAPDEQERISQRAAKLLTLLGLPYRIVDICTGDLGGAHHRSHDYEVYSPGVDRWLEVSSVSWYSDYQARRANIRFRPADGGPNAICHTVNGSAMATPRVWAALVETYRQADGSVKLPEVLHQYMGGTTVIAPVG